MGGAIQLLRCRVADVPEKGRSVWAVGWGAREEKRKRGLDWRRDLSRSGPLAAQSALVRARWMSDLPGSGKGSYDRSTIKTEHIAADNLQGYPVGVCCRWLCSAPADSLLFMTPVRCCCCSSASQKGTARQSGR